MIYSPKKYEDGIIKDINKELLELEGELTDEQAKVSLAKFLRYNLDLSAEWITGVRLPAYQLITLKSFFLRNYAMCIFGRGTGKSFMIALGAFLVSIMEPGTNIIICGPVFRVVKNIFSYLEKIQENPDAILLRQCLGKLNKGNDLYTWKIGDSMIRGIPNNGQRTRGMRANVLFVDEFFQMSEQIVKEVLTPFLVSPTNVADRIKTRKREDDMIREGIISESQREIFKNNTRMICTSSASYSFEFLYRLFQDWTKKIYSDDPVGNAKYFIQQVSWEAVPEYLMSKEVIEEAKGQNENSPGFRREYRAHFVDDSAGFFSAEKMAKLTVKDGDKPTVLLKGDVSKKYILSLDPNLSNSPTGDYFSMGVFELDEENEKIVLVHNFGVAGEDLSYYIKYFYYLIHSFNIVLIIMDNQDCKFIESVNSSALFQRENIKYDFIDYDGELKDDDFTKMINNIKNQYNLSNRKICFKQVFGSDSVRRINEQLQTWIDRSKIIFGARLTPSNDYEEVVKEKIPYPFSKEDLEGEDMSEEKFVYNLIEAQDDWIFQVKKQAAMIEVGTSPLGKLTFDFPANLKADRSVRKARKDNYTALLLGVEAASAYFKMTKTPLQSKSKELWTPMMMGKSTY